MVSKRTGARATAPAAKKAKMDPVSEKVKEVIDALKDDEECQKPEPARCFDGLLGALPHAIGLGAASDERHNYQDMVANIIKDMLTTTEARWEKRVEAAKTGQEASKAEQVARDAIREDAKGRLSAGCEAVEEAKTQVKADVKSEHDAQKTLKEATNDVDNFDGIQLAKATERDEYASLLKDVFDVLRAAEWESPADQKKFEQAHLGKLTTMLRKLKIDESLLSAMGPALKAKPEGRGAFGEMTLSSVEGAMKKHLENLESELNNGEATKTLKLSDQSDAQAALEAASVQLAASREALKAAEEKVVELEEAVKQASKSCEEQAEVISDYDVKLYIDGFGLEKSKDTFKTFAFLRDRVAAAPEPEVEEVAEPTAEPMAEPAAEPMAMCA